LDLDGTPNKIQLGEMQFWCFSGAAKAAANEVAFIRYVGGVSSNTLPVPMMNIINDTF
jgi:enolase